MMVLEDNSIEPGVADKLDNTLMIDGLGNMEWLVTYLRIEILFK
jgi:hypothetical protein